MVTIGIDARLYFQTGVGVYLRNLIYFLQEMPTENMRFYVYVLAGDEKNIQLEKENFIKKTVRYHWHSLSEQIGFAKTLYDDDLDLMHFTYFSYPVIYRKKFIATVHDVTPLLHKTGTASAQNILFYEFKHAIFRFVLSSQIHNGLHIITPTETVKSQILDIFGQKITRKIEPIYEGIDRELMNVSPKDPILPLSKPFFIYVGNFYPHKNIEALVKAYSQVNHEAKLILLGPEDYFTSLVKKYVESLQQQNRIALRTSTSRSELVYYYKHALALIHPSLSEGFGLPIIEAAYFKLPIIASRIPVFSELLGGQYIAFDPKDPHDIAEKINLFLRQKPHFNYVNLLKKCSFESMAEKTLRIYQKHTNE